MHTVFEVSKKYRVKGYPDIYECVWTDGKFSTLKALNYGNAFVTESTDWYEEVIEPRKEYFNAFRMTERTLSKGNITETRYQGPFNLEIEADHRIKDLPRGSYYGRLIMTHHSETEVTVEFHLKR